MASRGGPQSLGCEGCRDLAAGGEQQPPSAPPLPPPQPRRTPQPRRAAWYCLTAARSRSLAGCVRPSVSPSHEPRSEDQSGGPAVPDASQRGEGKEPRQAPRWLQPLAPPVLPLPAGRRWLRGRVLGFAAPGAQRSPLARRLSAGTRRAGAARLGWSPAPGCMLIRRGGGVPRFLRPTTGAGGRAAAAARSQALPPAPAATEWPLALVLAKARASRAAGRRWRLPEGALAPAQPPLAGMSAPSRERTPASQPRARGGHPLVGVTYLYPCATSWGKQTSAPVRPALLPYSAILSRESRPR